MAREVFQQYTSILYGGNSMFLVVTLVNLENLHKPEHDKNKLDLSCGTQNNLSGHRSWRTKMLRLLLHCTFHTPFGGRGEQQTCEAQMPAPS